MPAKTHLDITLCFNRSLRRASNRVLRFYDCQLAACGLRAVEFAILAHIERLGVASITELADGLMMSRATFRYKFAPLERAQLVAAVADPDDGRGRLMVLTEAGAAKLADAWEFWTEAQTAVQTAVGPQAETFKAMTDALGTMPLTARTGTLAAT